MKLLLVEDEPMLLEEMEHYLSERGYLCERATTFDEAEDKITLFKYDVVILDITLPGGSGLKVLEQLKKKKDDAGVLIISARDSLQDKILGLQTGADDYITKPFHLEELNARVDALLRRKYARGQNHITVDEDFIIDTNAQQALFKGQPIHLTKKEYELLVYFVVNKNRVVSKQSIIEHLWGDHFGMMDNQETIYVHTMNLRKKIAATTGHDYIKTAYGMGYKFVAK